MFYFYLKVNSDLSKRAQWTANLDSSPSFVTNWFFRFRQVTYPFVFSYECGSINPFYLRSNEVIKSFEELSI